MLTGQVFDAWTQHGGEPTAHPRSSRSSTTAVEAARAAMASQPTWLAAEAFAARALHHTNLLRKLLRHVRDERSLPPKHSLLCTAPHKPIRKLLRNARLVHNTSNRAGSTSVNGASVRCAAAKTFARRHNTCDHGSWLASEAFAPLRCTTQTY